jgi:hypothetical protein
MVNIPPLLGRDAVSVRNSVKWIVPEQPIIEMYINPENIQTNYKKVITKQRTKGGHVVQYWGEELTTLGIRGTTGTAGIEGINVLLNVYRNEQLAFDPYAIYLEAYNEKQNEDNFFSDLFGNIGEQAVAVGNQLSSLSNTVSNIFSGDASSVSMPSTISKPKDSPTLASLAFGVEMYWSGEIYRGYFESFNVTESADKLGIFNYDLSFTVTQKRGTRHNFMAWHQNPNYGQSNWNIPRNSFSSLNNEYETAQNDERTTVSQSIIDAFDLF